MLAHVRQVMSERDADYTSKLKAKEKLPSSINTRP
ncbi:hypothetical protein V6Z12_A09G075300 [Gossypium hirsutum]